MPYWLSIGYDVPKGITIYTLSHLHAYYYEQLFILLYLGTNIQHLNPLVKRLNPLFLLYFLEILGAWAVSRVTKMSQCHNVTGGGGGVTSVTGCDNAGGDSKKNRRQPKPTPETSPYPSTI